MTKYQYCPKPTHKPNSFPYMTPTSTMNMKGKNRLGSHKKLSKTYVREKLLFYLSYKYYNMTN